MTVEVIMKTENSTVYIADDGKRFATETECKNYEETVIKRKKSLKFFYIVHGPDLTEGRGMYGLTYMAIESTYVPINAIMDYCFFTFGRPVAFVQGCAETDNWTVYPTDEAEFNKWPQKKMHVGDYKYPAKVLFISNGEKLEGLPEPIKLYSWVK